jgi:hypothetical protein
MKPLIEKHLEEQGATLICCSDYCTSGAHYEGIQQSHISLAVKILEKQIEEIKNKIVYCEAHEITSSDKCICEYLCNGESSVYNYNEGIKIILSHLEKELSEIKSLIK